MMTHEAFVKFWAVLVLVGLQSSCYSSQNVTSLNRWKRQTCRENYFKCGSGECIPETLVCDGERNCEDRSDETTDTCINLVIPVLASYLNTPLTSYVHKCPSNHFRCDNGNCIPNSEWCNNRKDCSDGSDEKGCGSTCRSSEFKCRSGSCIASNQVCNRVKDCVDGSDESLALCGSSSTPPTPPQETSSCQLPSHPQNGEYHVGGCEPPSCQISPGTTVDNFSILNYTCNQGFKLTGQSIVWCNNKAWSSPFPTCKKVLCPALKDPSRSFDCILAGASVNCSEPTIPGTTATIKCGSFYVTRPELSNYDITCKENGEWSNLVYSCTPKCGLPNPNGLPFIANGRVAKLAEFPWHVGIFKKVDDEFIQSCGGNIITPRVVLTAAHCFWDEHFGKPFDISNFKIAAGKYYRYWNKTTQYFQESEIEKIDIMRGFKGIKALYIADLAVVTLKKQFEMNEAVRPICLDLDEKFSEDFKPGKTGIVVGWGYTEQQTQSEELHAIELPYEDRAVCIEKSREAFIEFITVFDKFCVGTNTGKNVCAGDSGGGFATKYETRYYLMGIVSAGVRPQGHDNCDFTQYSTFTKVSHYYSFIRPHVIV